MNRTAQYRSFAEFYPYYLGEHQGNRMKLT